MRLAGKVAFISGSTRGIGRSMAEMFAAEGAQVVVSGRSVDKGEKVAERIRAAGGDATFIRLDVADEASVQEAIAATIARYGKLTTLINNAAPTDLVSAGFKPMHELTTDEWEAILRTTLTGNVFWASKYAIPHLIERGGGSIIMTSSMSAMAGDLHYAAYGSSKGGLNSFTRYVATQYGKHRIRANAICPGLVVTPAARSLIPPEMLAIYEGNHLTPELGAPDQVAAVAVFLASDAAGYVTGQAIPVDGGLYAHLPTYAQMRAAEA